MSPPLSRTLQSTVSWQPTDGDGHAPQDRPDDRGNPAELESSAMALSHRPRRAERSSTLAVTIQDIEPRTFGRVREIREWLTLRGIDRLTLAVIPAADLHSVGTRAPLLAAWLRARVARGDAIAQHGLRHRGSQAEFTHLDRDESRGRVEAGLTLLREVELDPHGFIAPAYGYTPALRAVLGKRFAWFGERAWVCAGEQTVRARALGLGTSGPAVRLLGPALAGARVPFCGALMRLDINPRDFDLPRHVTAIERILDRAAERQVITYDDVFCPAG